MPSYTQANRLLAVTTPLGKDALLLIGFGGQEAISQLFEFRLDLLAPKENPIAFDRILGQPATVKLALAGGSTRFFNGIVKRFSQGQRDDDFTHFEAEVVPQFWLWTKKVQSRIFQHLTIPDILKQVLAGLNVKWELKGSYQPRDYCVQYRESDFAFASRLMEEEGIYYFFSHSDGAHPMTVTDVPNQHPDVPGPTTVIYEEAPAGIRDETRITVWEKAQELRSGQYTLWDHHFELPGNNLEAKQTIQDGVPVGKVTHKLRVGGNDKLEIYEYPGIYAQRFDGVDKGGGNQAAQLQNVFTDNKRTVKIRMEQEAVPSIEITGTSNCGQFEAGHQFTLTRHFDADGAYLVTGVTHEAQLGGNYRSGQDLTLEYKNRFSSIPAGLPYRPPQVTPRPTIASTQTATVVGPAGEDIFCDKYGRVKVQFHWDRQGKHDLDSSCWIRVAQVWAGKGWGAFFWPRIGNEVVVAFEEGDPDQPLIVGCVYNAANMPPFVLPLNNNLGGIKSVSVRGDSGQNYNGIVFDDELGREHLSIHSERHLTFNSELDKLFASGRHKVERVNSVSLFTVGHLPGGGGSGGGPDPYFAYTPPQATGVFGLNGTMVYGENLQVAAGVNHQFALGSNLQVCLNPGGLAAGIVDVPGTQAVTGYLGSGIGGNMQLTIGTNASFVAGRNITLNLGPKAINMDPGKTHIDSSNVLIALSLVYTAWILAYAVPKDDDSDTNAIRTIITLGAQLVIDALLITLMEFEMTHYVEENKTDETKKDVFAAEMGNARMAGFEEGPMIGLATLLAVVLPIAGEVVTAYRSKTSAAPPDQPSGSGSSSGSSGAGSSRRG
jgi:type VI secretion system secreted protein VgrG